MSYSTLRTLRYHNITRRIITQKKNISICLLPNQLCQCAQLLTFRRPSVSPQSGSFHDYVKNGDGSKMSVYSPFNPLPRLLAREISIEFIRHEIFQLYVNVLMLHKCPQLVQEGTKLQRQKTLMFLYPIYNHNWRNISTIYIYNKTDIKRNILTNKQNTLGSRSG